MKIVINKCYGGFDVSDKCREYLKENGVNHIDRHDKQLRTNPYLIKFIEENGLRASGFCSTLRIIEIPDDIEWEINGCDGMEWIAEKHRTWSYEDYYDKF